MEEEGEEERWWLLFLWRRKRRVWRMRGQPLGGRGEHEELLLWCLREEVRG